jgi:putative ABC transport system ATP-binding protein
LASSPERAVASLVERTPLLSLRGVTKVYGNETTAVQALDHVDLDVKRGEFVAITGASGSGKSTTLSIFGCLELPSAGEYRIDGVAIQDLSPDVLAALRNTCFGFVFQTFNLLPRTSALDNVALPLIYADVPAGERWQRSLAALDAVEMAARADALPSELSGGQQQRVAIARAIVNEPQVLLADEPTGNLDSRMGADILALIDDLNRTRGITVLMVTHDATWAKYAGREVVFRDGAIVADQTRTRG